MYCNLIPRPGEPGPRINLDGRNEWRAFFTIIEAAAARRYEVDNSGCFKVDFQELHKIFSAGRRGALIEETAQALEALSRRKFDIIDPEKIQNGQKASAERCLFAYDGNIRIVDEIQIHRIFYHNIENYFMRLPADFLKTLSAAIQAAAPGGRMTNADIILSLYAYQTRHSGRPHVKKDITTLARWSGMAAFLKTWQSKRIFGIFKRSAEVLKTLNVISGYYFEGDNITLFFAVKPQAERQKENLDLHLRHDTISG